MFTFVTIGLSAILVFGMLIGLGFLTTGKWARRVDEWAALRGVELTDRSRPMVAWYLRTASTLRRMGVVAGMFLPPFVVWAFGTSGTARLPYWTWVFLGYLVGSVYAEVSLVRRGPSGVRVAALAVRDVATYLGEKTLRMQRALATVAALAVVAVALVPLRPDHFGSDRNWAIVVASATTAFALALEPIERWLVRRPQPFTEDDLVAADDAIRAASIRSVAGGGLAIVLLGLSATTFWLGESDVQLFRWTMWAVALVLFLAALWAGSAVAASHRPVTRARAAVG